MSTIPAADACCDKLCNECFCRYRLVILEAYRLNLAGLELYILCEFMSLLVSVDGNLELVAGIGSERLDGEVELGYAILGDGGAALYGQVGYVARVISISVHRSSIVGEVDIEGTYNVCSRRCGEGYRRYGKRSSIGIGDIDLYY